MKTTHPAPAPAAAVLLLTLPTLLSPSTAHAQSQLVFTDVTAEAGVGLPGTLTESLAWGDYDGDGDPDLYLTNNGPNRLFRNDGDGRFTEVAAEAGVDHPLFSVGTAFGDLDNDGDLDLYVVTFQQGPDVLYRNDGPVGPGAQPTFTDIAAEAGIIETRSSRGVTLVDYDQDGLLDIYVNAIGDDLLYHNLGGLQFEEVARSLRVDTDGQGVGVVASDLDGNGWPDLFTGNRSGDPNRLYLNDGGSFTDATEAAGITETGLGMGVLSFDYDNDLDFDLYWTIWPDGASPRNNALYRNRGDARFTETAAAAGTTDPLGWGISCNAGDVDNDGWEDFFVTNGFSSSSSPNVLFHNRQDGTFADATAVLGGGSFDGRGVAFADYDGDGDVDLMVTGGPSALSRLWRNDTLTGNAWLTLELVGTTVNRSAVGARVEVTTDLRTTVKEVSGGAGRGSQNDLPLEFGLGAARAVPRVVIHWPGGGVQTLEDVPLNRRLRVIEGEAPDLGNPGVLQLTRSDYSSGESDGGAVIAVERSGGDRGEVRVRYRTTAAGGSATPGEDFKATSGMLTFADGETGEKSFEIPILDDDVAEPDETVEVALSAPTGGARLGRQRATLTLVDDDEPAAPGTVELERDGFFAGEGDAEAAVRLVRSGGNGELTVTWRLESLSATAGEDFTAATGSVTWTDGENGPKSFPVALLDDAAAEGSELVRVVLEQTSPAGALGERTSAVVVIGDDDANVACEGDGGDGGTVAGALCLLDDRFRVEAEWRDPRSGDAGRAGALPRSDQTGLFWFFTRENIELVVKMIDGRAAGGAFWFFYGALSDVEYWLVVTDTLSGNTRLYRNPPRTLAGFADTRAFVEAPPGAAPQPAAGPPASPKIAGEPPTDRPDASSSSCVPTDTAHCLLGGRFRVEVEWSTTQGTHGSGRTVPESDATGLFWFFDPRNLELAVKILDGRDVNGKFWVFYGALSNVEYSLTVTDTANGKSKIYANPQGTLASVADTDAFD